MIEPSSLLTFLAAAIVLTVTPGPAVLYVVTRTLAQGRRAGLVSVAGVALGNLGNALGASVGLAALFALSSLAFTVVKYAGALYLVWLGVKALRAPRAPHTGAPPAMVRQRQVFRDGFVVALLNPKTALFFAAFLPQFIDAAAGTFAQSVVFGSLFVLIAAATDSVYVLAAGRLAPKLAQMGAPQRLGRYAAGCAFIGLGLYTALSGSRAKGGAA